MATPNELHYHECPTTGCHKKWTCTGPCGRWYFKACEAHEAKPPAPAVPPVAEVKPPTLVETLPVPPVVEVTPPAALVETAPASPEVSEPAAPVEPVPPSESSA